MGLPLTALFMVFEYQHGPATPSEPKPPGCSGWKKFCGQHRKTTQSAGCVSARTCSCPKVSEDERGTQNYDVWRGWVLVWRQETPVARKKVSHVPSMTITKSKERQLRRRPCQLRPIYRQSRADAVVVMNRICSLLLWRLLLSWWFSISHKHC